MVYPNFHTITLTPTDDDGDDDADEETDDTFEPSERARLFQEIGTFSKEDFQGCQNLLTRSDSGQRSDHLDGPDRVERDFEKFLDEYGFSGEKRENLSRLAFDQKRALLSHLPPLPDGAEASVDWAVEFEKVLDSLHISGVYREDVLHRTTLEQKKAIVTQYRKRAADEAVKASTPDPTDEFTDADIDRALEAALSDPTINITGSARVNILRNSSMDSKRMMVKQFELKKEKGPSATLLTDAVLDDELRLEAVCCISIIMNHKVGMTAVLNNPGIIKQIAFCLSNAQDSNKASCLVLIVGMVSAPESTEDRFKLRIEVESRGLRAVCEALRLWHPPPIVLEHIDLYLEDREEDFNELEEEFKELNESLREPEETIRSLFTQCRSLQDPERSSNMLMRSLSNLTTLITALQHHSSTGVLAKVVADASSREQALFALDLTEHVTESISGSVALWSKSDSIGHVTNRKNRFQDLAMSLIRGVEITGGVPLHVNLGSSKGHGNEVEAGVAAMASDLQNVRALYTNALVTISEQKKEIQEQRTTILDLESRLDSAGGNSGSATDPFNDPRVAAEIKRLTEESQRGSASLREEIANLHSAIESIKRERDELSVRVLDMESNGSQAPARSTPKIGSPMSTTAQTLARPHEPEQPLQWSKVPPKNFSRTVWKDVVSEAYLENYAAAVLDETEVDQLQSLFRKTNEHVATRPLALQKKVTLLEMARARNMEILLGSLRVELVQSFPGDASDLGMAERFVLTMASIPRFRQRLQAIIYRRKFRDEVEEIEGDLRTIAKATKAVRESGRLKKVLEVVLVLGNFLNAGSFRGHAYGFYVDNLLRLKETRADDDSDLRDRAPTLLHYVARRVEETDGDVADLADELAPAELASRVSFQALFRSARGLGRGIDQIKDELDELKRLSSTSEEDLFADVMQAFVASAEVRVREVVRRAGVEETAVRETLEFFGEDVERREEPPEDFFRVLWEFQAAITRAASENAAADQRAVKDGRANGYSRRSMPTPMQLAVQKRKAQLKPVRGMDPFAKRMTVRGGPQAARLVARTGDLEEMGRAMREGTTFRSALAARKTVRRLGTMAKGGAGKQRTTVRVGGGGMAGLTAAAAGEWGDGGVPSIRRSRPSAERLQEESEVAEEEEEAAEATAPAVPATIDELVDQAEAWDAEAEEDDDDDDDDDN
ncbi:hypothetical protein HK405_005858 [Cladochytrium tenue]|nr:hypothetical protein HK405_005858 [Cladochytrium tenue]